MTAKMGALLSAVIVCGSAFPGSTSVAFPGTGIRSEVVRDTNALPKNRGARRRAAARKKGGTK